MQTRAKIGNHPIHPMLIGLPIGLFVFSFISDVIYLTGWGSVEWSTVAYRTMFGGVICGLVAAVPGFIDYLGLTDAKAKETATKHMIANLTVVGLFIINLIARQNLPTTTFPFILSLIAIGTLSYSGWKGWDLVYEHRVGVTEGKGTTGMTGREPVSGPLYGKQETRTEEHHLPIPPGTMDHGIR